MSDKSRPEHPPPRTTDRLRTDIDRGRTGDKVAFSDPATAPLGTDDEAAGTPPSKEAIAHAARQEGATTPPRQPGRPDRAGQGWITWLFIACIVALGFLVVAGAYWPR